MATENESRALTNVDVTYTNPGCTCEDGTVANWITADFRIVITPDGSTYTVQIYTRLYAKYYMTWSGPGTLYVNIKWTGTDGSSKSYSNSLQTTTPLQGTGQQSNWNGPLTFTGISAVGAKSLNFNIDLDLLRTICLNHGTYSGPDYERSSGSDTHFQHFYLTKDINVESIPLVPPVVKPTIATLANTNKYNSQDGVSASTNSISLEWTHSAGNEITESYYKIGNGSWTKTTNVTSHVITNLAAGTSYAISVYSKNSAGDSNTLTTTIRTRYAAPVVKLELSSLDLDTLGFKWQSDKSLASTQYKIDNGQWINLNQTGTNNTFVINNLNPATEYTVYFKGVSTTAYDGLASNESNSSGTTYDIARITSLSDCIFGQKIDIGIVSSSSKQLKLQISATGNSKEPVFEFTNISTGTFTFTPTQTQLDEIYKCFTNADYVPIYFSLITVGNNEWNDKHIRALQLTGIAKTTHIGVNNVPRRAQAWIGVNNIPRRSVVWVGDDKNVPRRCI